jgi:hypothetical protein
MKKTFLLILVVALSFSAIAQITITYTDWSNVFKPGTVTSNYQNQTTSSVNIGSTGSTSWNFQGLPSVVGFQSSYLAPNGTPYSNMFPNTNLAFTQTQAAGSSVMTVYGYYLASSSGYQFLGLIGTSTIQPGITSEMRIKKSTPEQLVSLPLTYNTAWNASFMDTMYSFMNGTLMSTTYNNRSISYLVDAYGSLTMPNGQVYQALRIREDEKSTTRTSLNPTIIYKREISYSFVTKEGISIDIDAFDTLQANTGTINVTKISWDLIGTSDVEDDGILPSRFLLEQNYPNPFNPSTVISFKVPKNSFVSIKIYNVIGDEIATLVNEQKSPGKYSVNFDGSKFSSGVYFCKMRTDNFIQTNKMILVK